jgi:hypothetical protein
MTKPYSVGWAAYSDYLPDRTSIASPGTTSGGGSLPDLPYGAGDWIVRNMGPSLTYTGADGTTITFGASLVSGAYSGTASNVTDPTQPYTGPYSSLAASVANLNDDAFRDIEILGQAEWGRAPNSGTVAIDWTSGPPQVTDAHIVNESVSYPQTSRNHHTRGQFVGGVFALSSGAAPCLSVVENTSSGDTLYFATDDGNWDGITPGRYRIIGPLSHNIAGTSRLLIEPASGIGDGHTSYFPSSVGGALITFVPIFPGLAENVATGSGGSMTAQPWYIRYCWTKSLTLPVSGGGTATNTIETALSPLVYSGGLVSGSPFVTPPASGTIAFDVPPMPHGFTGVTVYIGTGQDLELRLVSGAFTYNPTGGTGDNGRITITAPTTVGNGLPSYGFWAWPAGANIASAVGSDTLMKLATLSSALDISGQYVIHGYNSGTFQRTQSQLAAGSVAGGQDDGSGTGTQLPGHLHPESVFAAHMNSMTTVGGTTPVTAGYVPTAVGDGTVTYQAPAGLPTVGAASTSGILYYDNGGVPAWAMVSTIGFHLVFYNGGALQSFAPVAAGALVTGASGAPGIAYGGTAGELLVSNGTGTPPDFGNALRSGSISVTLDASGNGSGTYTFTNSFANTPVVLVNRGGDWFDTDSSSKKLYAEVYAHNETTTTFDYVIIGAVNKASTAVTLKFLAVDNAD